MIERSEIITFEFCNIGTYIMSKRLDPISLQIADGTIINLLADSHSIEYFMPWKSTYGDSVQFSLSTELPMQIYGIKYQHSSYEFNREGFIIMYINRFGTLSSIYLNSESNLSPVNVIAHNTLGNWIHVAVSKKVYMNSRRYAESMDVFDEVIEYYKVLLPDEIYYTIADMIRGDGRIKLGYGYVDEFEFPATY